jgi:hypothetical protein
VDATLFDQKAAEWRSEQRSLLRAIEAHQGANESYLDDGVKLLELAKRRDDTARRCAHVLGLVRSRGYRCRLRERLYNASDMRASSQ